jgi:cytochrome P450
MNASVDLSGSLAGDLHGVLRVAAEAGPLATDAATGATVVLRHRDVEALARDQRLVGVGLTFFDLMGITDGPLRDWYSRLMFTTEGEYHRRMRSLVQRAFTPRSVEALRAPGADMATEAVASVTRDGGDLVDACSMLATRMTCRLLGVPDSDVPVFAQWADALSPIFFIMTSEQIAAATDALAGLLSYVDELTRRRAEDPGPDLITALLAAEADGERLTHDETVTMIANLLLAGHDTTGSQIPCTLLVALGYQDELAGIGEDQARLASAVSETMRMEPSIAMIPRTAVAPIDLHGSAIPTGSMVMLCSAAANRDPTAWRDPDRFDPDRFSRPDTPKLLIFGAGQHFCLGTALAKVTLEECVRAVLTTDPPLRLAEAEADIPWRVVLGRSPTRLMVNSAVATA